MEINNAFEVKAPIDVAWATLTDLARIAPCLPGATLTSIEGDIYKGHVTVKVGPIVAKFGGQAIFQERDDAAHRAVLKGEGRDSTGKGNASAIITAQLESVDANTTRCTVNTDLTITGKIAQFGRGALADVSDKLLKQFVVNLESTVLAQELSNTAGAGVSGVLSSLAFKMETCMWFCCGRNASALATNRAARTARTALLDPGLIISEFELVFLFLLFR